MKKKLLIGTSILITVLISVFVLTVFFKTSPIKVLYENGQMGIITNKSKKLASSVYIDNQEVAVYQTVSKLVEICYESYNLDNNYQNKIIINETKAIELNSRKNQFNTYISNNIKILGLNIVDGKLSLSFQSGTNNNNNFNSFSIRNVFIKIGKEKIWSIEYPESDYLNEFINLGEDDLNPDVRFNYQSKVQFTFDIDKKLLDAEGTIITNNFNKEINVKTDKKQLTFKNESLLDISCNITHNEVINQTKTIEVIKDENITFLEIKMDGLKINNSFRLNHNAWSPGEHILEINCTNKFGFTKREMITFTLGPITDNGTDILTYDIYQMGVSQTLYNGIKQIGVFNNSLIEETNSIDDKYLITPYSEFPVITFVINKENKTNFNWTGKVNKGRTAFMQIYNGESWETVSTAQALESESVQLGFDYEGLAKYEIKDKIYVRISSVLNPLTNLKITHKLCHWTDMQYVIQLITVSAVESTMWKAAKKALEDTVNFIIDEYRNNNLMYLAMTGDLVQQQKGKNTAEWDNFTTYILKPLMAAGVPLGVSSGNHDVGGVSSYHPDGGNTLDENLFYDYYHQYLGEDIFKELPYYGGSYDNNRSHYDLITINGHEFLFLFLGWGSSTRYIHVSNKDIEWAKTVLEQYPNKTVVIGTHEYMGSKGKRTLTGDYVYNLLVKNYKNIKFVISGHINGSSHLIDNIDDDGDGIFDRQVLQILTDFQEEENYYGTLFLRMIGLDFENNYMYFNVYSPFHKDYDIFVQDNVEYVKASTEFYYAFDLKNCGYGLLTDYFG